MTRKTKQILAIVGAALFVLALITVTAAVLFFPAQADGDKEPRATGKDSSSNPGKDQGKDADGGAGSASPELDLPPVTFDENGIAQMQVTTDPRVAAASAAQVLWSVDTTKVKFAEDYVTHAIAEISKPSPEYQGAGESVMYQPDPASDVSYSTDEWWERVPAVVAGMEYNPTGWWWQLGDASEFEQFGYREATLKSVPITVFDAAETDTFVDGAWWTAQPKSLTVNLKPGAQFEQFWVRVETEITTPAGDIVTSRNPVALSIYCDPPEDGGICGVKSLITKYPQVWQLH